MSILDILAYVFMGFATISLTASGIVVYVTAKVVKRDLGR